MFSFSFGLFPLHLLFFVSILFPQNPCFIWQWKSGDGARHLSAWRGLADAAHRWPRYRGEGGRPWRFSQAVASHRLSPASTPSSLINSFLVLETRGGEHLGGWEGGKEVGGWEWGHRVINQPRGFCRHLSLWKRKKKNCFVIVNFFPSQKRARTSTGPQRCVNLAAPSLNLILHGGYRGRSHRAIITGGGVPPWFSLQQVLGPDILIIDTYPLRPWIDTWTLRPLLPHPPLSPPPGDFIDQSGCSVK